MLEGKRSFKETLLLYVGPEIYKFLRRKNNNTWRSVGWKGSLSFEEAYDRYIFDAQFAANECGWKIPGEVAEQLFGEDNLARDDLGHKYEASEMHIKYFPNSGRLRVFFFVALGM